MNSVILKERKNDKGLFVKSCIFKTIWLGYSLVITYIWKESDMNRCACEEFFHHVVLKEKPKAQSYQTSRRDVLFNLFRGYEL